MWDLIVSVPDHCLSFYFPSGHGPNKFANRCSHVPDGKSLRVIGSGFEG